MGNIDPETLKPLVEKYIGSIPAARKPISYVDDKAYPVKGEVTEEFTAPMQQPKVSVNYHFSGEMPYTLKNKMALTFLTQALNSRYLVSIREEKGGTYGVRVQGSTKYIPRETYSMTISFDTNEEMADELREIVMKEIEEIAANGPKSEDIEKHREFMLKSWKNSLEQNGAWMNYIQIKYGSGLNHFERPRTGDPRPDQRRRAGARQEDPCGRNPREGRHAPAKVSTKTNDFSKQQNQQFHNG